MRKFIFLLTLAILPLSGLFAQANSISFAIGYPVNLTQHYTIDNWEKPIELEIRYSHRRNKLAMGSGIEYSGYHISWFEYYNGEENTFTTLSPYLLLGCVKEKGVFSFVPNIKVGYAFIFTQIEIYEGKKGGPFISPGFDFNFDLNDRMQIGTGAAYSLTFVTPDFAYGGVLPDIVFKRSDERMSKVDFHLSFSYKL